ELDAVRDRAGHEPESSADREHAQRVLEKLDAAARDAKKRAALHVDRMLDGIAKLVLVCRAQLEAFRDEFGRALAAEHRGDERSDGADDADIERLEFRQVSRDGSREKERDDRRDE